MNQEILNAGILTDVLHHGTTFTLSTLVTGQWKLKIVNTEKIPKMSKMVTGLSPSHFILEKQETKLKVEYSN